MTMATGDRPRDLIPGSGQAGQPRDLRWTGQEPAAGPRCEHADGPPCGARAMWHVMIGSRHSDAQLSCGNHLSRTCEVMRGAEGRDVTLHVTRVWRDGTW